MDSPAKGSTISVTVEEAFENCLIISYAGANKILRGVLLDEEQNKPVIRSNCDINLCASKLSNLYTGNLGVTAARACPSFSGGGIILPGRMSTRSLTMTQPSGASVVRLPDSSSNKSKDMPQSTQNSQKSGNNPNTKKTASPVALRKGHKQLPSTSATSTNIQDAKNKKASNNISLKRRAGKDFLECGKPAKLGKVSPSKTDLENSTTRKQDVLEVNANIVISKDNVTVKKKNSPSASNETIGPRQINCKINPATSCTKRQLDFQLSNVEPVTVKKKSFVEKMSNLEKCIDKMRTFGGSRSDSVFTNQTIIDSASIIPLHAAVVIPDQTEEFTDKDNSCLFSYGKSADDIMHICDTDSVKQSIKFNMYTSRTIQTRSKSPRLGPLETSSTYCAHARNADDANREVILIDNPFEKSSIQVPESTIPNNNLTNIASPDELSKESKITESQCSHDYGTRKNYANTVGNIVRNAKSNDYVKLSQTKGHLNQLIKYVPLSGDSLENIKAETSSGVDEGKPARTGPRMKTTPIIKVIPKNTPASPGKKASRVCVGDIIWGKIHGHPWWPGRVLAISGNLLEGGNVTRIAHVAWLASSTSSFMPCKELLLFTEFFKERFKKRKKGAYRVAVREAQEAVQSAAAAANACVIDVLS